MHTLFTGSPPSSYFYIFLHCFCHFSSYPHIVQQYILLCLFLCNSSCFLFLSHPWCTLQVELAFFLPLCPLFFPQAFVFLLIVSMPHLLLFISDCVFNRPISFVRWHLGALINICYMWLHKGGAETRPGAATIHLAPAGQSAGLWFTNTCWENCCRLARDLLGW